MTKEAIIFEKLDKLKKEIEILANPLSNDLWKDVYDKICEAHKILFKDKRIYGW